MKVKVLQDPENFKVYHKLNGIEKMTKRAVRQGMFRWAKDLKIVANKAILAKDKTGRIYKIRTKSGRMRTHQSSAPGQSHANLSGDLRKSIGWNVIGSDRLEFGYGLDKVKKAPEYAQWIEFGTEANEAGHVRLKPRPSIQNAITKTQGTAETYFNDEIKKINES
jgi:hypothetical protein